MSDTQRLGHRGENPEDIKTFELNYKSPDFVDSNNVDEPLEVHPPSDKNSSFDINYPHDLDYPNPRVSKLNWNLYK